MGAKLSETGDVWGTSYPPVISGHIHDYGQPQPNIIYTGTPLQHAFGDTPNKSVSWITLNKDVETKKVRIYHERVRLGLPKKIMIRVVAREIDSVRIVDGNQTKVVITGTADEIKTIKKRQDVIGWGKKGVKVVYREIPSSNPLRYAQVERKKFSDILAEVCGTDPYMKQEHTELFGGYVPPIHSSGMEAQVISIPWGK